MKRMLLSFLICVMTMTLPAQDTMEKIMESRAREFHKTLSLTEIESYKKFMIENYTKEFLEKPIKLNRMVSDSDGGKSSENKSIDNLNAKVGMYEQLHNDFGGAAISSLTIKGNTIELIIKSLGLKGKFTLMFSREKPYLIEGLGIEADMEN